MNRILILAALIGCGGSEGEGEGEGEAESEGDRMVEANMDCVWSAYGYNGDLIYEGTHGGSTCLYADDWDADPLGMIESLEGVCGINAADVVEAETGDTAAYEYECNCNGRPLEPCETYELLDPENVEITCSGYSDCAIVNGA